MALIGAGLNPWGAATERTLEAAAKVACAKSNGNGDLPPGT